MNQYILPFIAGLTSGGFSCFALQGSLLVSSFDKENNKIKLASFLSAKIISYTVVGALLGYLGSSIYIPIKIQGIIQIFIGLYMLATAARILNIHPIFKRTVIQTPKIFVRFLKKISVSKSVISPALLGLLTILIPCGVTQAMMLYVVGTGNYLSGAGTMFMFTLGTFPVFIVLGLISDKFNKNIFLTYISAIVLVIIGFTSINTGLILKGSTYTFQNYWNLLIDNTKNKDQAPIVNGFQEVEIEVSNSGYKTNTKMLKAGIPVKLRIVSNNVFSCSRSFVIPSINYSAVLPQSGTETIEFTPTQTGNLIYTCSMGMYTGSFTVTN